MQVLARQIAGSSASADIHLLAVRIAEAQIDLRRVQSVRRKLLSEIMCDPDTDSEGYSQMAFMGPRQITRVTSSPIERVQTTKPAAHLSNKLTAPNSEHLKQLAALNRYEASARKRRKFAILAFESARVKASL